MFEAVVGLGDRLAGLVDGLDPDAVSGPTAGELWAALDRVERLAAAGKTLLARRVADTHVPDRSGLRSAAEVLARRGGTTVGAARDAIEASNQLGELPTVAAAVRRGDLSPAQLAVVAGAAAADPRAERRLLELAGRASMPELREEAARVKAAADPDPDATNARLHAARRLRRYTDPDGAWTLIARGTPQAGAAINTALDPIIDQLFQSARRHGRRDPHEAYAFDALLTLAEHATRGDPMAASQAAADVADAGTGAADAGGGAPGSGALAPTPAPAPAVPPRRVNPRYRALLRVDLQALRRGTVDDGELCEITGVGPVPVSTARQLLGDAVLHLVITRGIDVANITHLGRGPTAAQRIALAWTNPTCTAAGCPRTRTEYDHQKPWKDTRHTRLDELDPLCEHHHDLKTRHGWALIPGTGKRAMVPPHDPRHPRHQPAPATGTPQPTDAHPASAAPPTPPQQQALPALGEEQAQPP